MRARVRITRALSIVNLCADCILESAAWQHACNSHTHDITLSQWHISRSICAICEGCSEKSCEELKWTAGVDPVIGDGSVCSGKLDSDLNQEGVQQDCRSDELYADAVEICRC
jgi:hypothetical protein